MSIDDELDEQLGRYGYKLETVALHNSNYQVRRLDGHGGHAATFEDVDGVKALLAHLAESDNSWCISLDHGDVDVDRTTGEVTPRDGGPLFNLHDLNPGEWSGASDDAPGGIGSATLMTADQVCIRSSSRPPYGGLWFKRT
jgi:hypothetical protein